MLQRDCSFRIMRRGGPIRLKATAPRPKGLRRANTQPRVRLQTPARRGHQRWYHRTRVTESCCPWATDMRWSLRGPMRWTSHRSARRGRRWRLGRSLGGGSCRDRCEGATLPARLAGRLVELDPQSVALVRSARQAIEPGGWVQGNLRNNGKYARVARFRPATALDVATGIANIVGTVAAQAQLAAIHRDVVRTLHEVQNVSAFQHAELVAAIHSDAKDVRHWVELMHELVPHGAPLTPPTAPASGYGITVFSA